MELSILLSMLAPAVPFLVGAASKVGDGVASKVGEDVWKQVKGKIGGKLAGHMIAKPAIEQMQKEPENANLKMMVELALKDLLEKDTALAEEVGKLLESESSGAGSGIQQQIGSMQNSKAVANISNVGGNVSL